MCGFTLSWDSFYYGTAPFLVSFPFSLAPSLLTFSYCHSRVATRVFFFLYPFFFWFLPTFPFLLHIFFPFPSLLLWRPFSFPFFLSLSLLLSFSPLLFGAPLRPPGMQAHAMHPPGYATAFSFKILLLKFKLDLLGEWLYFDGRIWLDEPTGRKGMFIGILMLWILALVISVQSRMSARWSAGPYRQPHSPGRARVPLFLFFLKLQVFSSECAHPGRPWLRYWWSVANQVYSQFRWHLLFVSKVTFWVRKLSFMTWKSVVCK